MPLKDHVPLMNFLGKLGLPIMYIISFAHSDWVVAGDTRWGLWQWCFTNHSNNGSELCHSIAPGDSPGYYEAVRTIGTFTLVFYIFHYFSFNEKEGLGKDNKPAFLSFLATLGAVITLGVLGGHYRDDARWKDQDPSLGWCIWLATSCAILSFLMIGVFWKHNRMRKESAVSQSPPNPANPDPPPPRRSCTASSISLEGRRKVTIFHTSAVGGGASSEPTASPAQDTTPRGSDAGVRGSGGQFPVLQLPRYQIAPEPESVASGSFMPPPPPPSYEDVMRGAGAMSPPPAYTVTASGVH